LQAACRTDEGLLEDMIRPALPRYGLKWPMNTIWFFQALTIFVYIIFLKFHISSNGYAFVLWRNWRKGARTCIR
jgi:hypothetical protein